MDSSRRPARLAFSLGGARRITFTNYLQVVCSFSLAYMSKYLHASLRNHATFSVPAG
jgi:hypothetical protein